LTEMSRWLIELNPAVRVSSRALDVVEQKHDFKRLLGRWRPDAIAVCTDNEQSKHAINQVALPMAVPQVGAGVYDGGIGGEVYKVVLGQACYGCIADHLQLGRFNPPVKAPANYNTLTADDPPAISALNLDIEQIAILQCRMLLEVLLGKNVHLSGLEPGINLWVFANRLVPGTFARPLRAEFFKIPQRQDCLYCGAPVRNIEEQAKRILDQLTRRGGNFGLS